MHFVLGVFPKRTLFFGEHPKRIFVFGVFPKRTLYFGRVPKTHFILGCAPNALCFGECPKMRFHF
jgi:hypothetical protein